MSTATPTPDRVAHRPLLPFTVDHFRAYARVAILENGEACEPEAFQLGVVEDIFNGALETWMVVPEGNGKTSLTGLLALYHADYTPTAAVLLGASSRDQCGLLLGQAAGFVYRTPSLAKRFRVFEGYRRITALRTDGRIQVYAADDRTGDGVIPTLVLLDELHRHRDMRLYRTWRGKLDKRGAQLVAISTAGEPGSEFELTVERTKRDGRRIDTADGHIRVRAGEMVLHQWAVPEGDDITDLPTVKRANPLKTITLASLARKQSSPSMTEGHWRRFTCGQSVRSEFAAVDEREWTDATAPEGPASIPDRSPIWVGIDPAWKVDSFAVVPYYEADADHRYLGAAMTFVPTPDGPVKPSAVKDYLRALHDRHPIEVAVMDTNFAADVAEFMADELGTRVVAHAQTDTPMGLAYERFMKLLRNHQLFHTGDPLLTQHVLNGIAHVTRSGLTRFARPSESRAVVHQEQRHIDALIAAAMVVSVAEGEGVKRKSRLTFDDFVVL